MKINVTVDLDDFWADEESLTHAIESNIKFQVLEEIDAKIKDKVDTHITRKVSEEIEKNMYRQMNSFIADFIKTGEVKSSHNSSKMVSIEEFIKEKFVYSSGWGSPDETIKKLAEKFSLEMKNRYDLLFASQLVAKMNESGLLKKDVAKILLAKP